MGLGELPWDVRRRLSTPAAPSAAHGKPLKGTCRDVGGPVLGAGQLPAARYASITSSLMRPRGETVRPLAAAHARTAAVSTPLKAALALSAALRRPRRGF